jgi:hypothetical protein
LEQKSKLLIENGQKYEKDLKEIRELVGQESEDEDFEQFRLEMEGQ